MADLGSIAVCLYPPSSFCSVAVNQYITGPGTGGWIDNAGYISGVVRDVLGNSVSGARVCLYYITTGELVRATKSASDGTFSFTGLPTDRGGVFRVEATDPAAGYNAARLDRLTPTA